MPNDFRLTNASFYLNGQHMGTTSGNLVWNTWVATTTTSTTSTNDVWTNWTNGSYTVPYRPQGAVYTLPQRTPEEQAADEARRIEQDRIWEEGRPAREAETARIQAEQAEAKRKARVILEEHLSEEQRKQLADSAWFEVVTPKGTYRIRTGWAGNVDRLVDGRATDRYCIHPYENVPVEDNMLAQKLLLEADEEAFLRIANRSTPYA